MLALGLSVCPGVLTDRPTRLGSAWVQDSSAAFRQRSARRLFSNKTSISARRHVPTARLQVIKQVLCIHAVRRVGVVTK